MTLWRRPVVGDQVQSKVRGNIFHITMEGQASYYWNVRENFQFVSVTPIEPPPEPLKRTVYVPVFKVEGRAKIVPGQVVFNSVEGQFAKTGEEAKKATSGFAHRVGIIKVELVEGQFDE